MGGIEAVGPVMTLLPLSTMITTITIEGQEEAIPVCVEGGNVEEARRQVAEAVIWVALGWFLLIALLDK